MAFNHRFSLQFSFKYMLPILQANTSRSLNASNKQEISHAILRCNPQLGLLWLLRICNPGLLDRQPQPSLPLHWLSSPGSPFLSPYLSGECVRLTLEASLHTCGRCVNTWPCCLRYYVLSSWSHRGSTMQRRTHYQSSRPLSSFWLAPPVSML